ncbi:DUF3427 domain-containing protein [Streptomyces sp. NPDC051662]|uniref:DUF3427 domain-containing protein n=1 Tax=Streptomyces sp. NPDC051662 TaxID=3154750 RepID=UPI00341ADE9C
MTDAVDSRSPEVGLYEQLITLRLEDRLKQLDGVGRRTIDAEGGIESTPSTLARHVSEFVRLFLHNLPAAERAHAANHILESVGTSAGAQEWIDLVADEQSELISIPEQQAVAGYAIRSELRAELATADRFDVISNFVKQQELSVLEYALRAANERGVPIRFITTTHLGATERHALDRLVDEFGAEVKVNYQPSSAHLHTKVWLFRRNSTYNTAYVESSKLSATETHAGPERNVRFSFITTPGAMQELEATFDSYWTEAAFELYAPDVHGEQLETALLEARMESDGTTSRTITVSGPEVTPYPHQQDMLERLEVERDVHDRHRNLLVAATGTGKTVMAALDYKTLRRRLGQDLRILFIAHRKEILEQSLQTYRGVLKDENFGELLVGGEIPSTWKHVFASVQSLNARALENLTPEHFDVVVIDEFHHGTAPTYRKIVDHFIPKELLGLTATPERMDGLNIQDEFFDGRIAAEMRLWEALENALLSPFRYFGIADSTDLSAIQWKRGSYEPTALSDVFTGNDKRAQLVVSAIEDKVSDPQSMRALGFCVSVAHAQFMAKFFQQAGLNAVALSGEVPGEQRKAALDALRSGELQVIFSVDLFNEGLDIPQVDTLLLLRPTSSATVFLQQLGRGLRRSTGKDFLTVLDFIGQHRKEFRFEEQFRSLTNLTRNRLISAIEHDFPQLPSDCRIILESKAKELIIDNIRQQISVNVNQLAVEVHRIGEPRLSTYLAESGREIKELYRGSNHSWTALLRRSKLLTTPAPDGEGALLKRASAFLHVDDTTRAAVYTRLLEDDAPSYDELSDGDRAYARMLFFTLWPLGGFDTYQAGLASLHHQHTARSELREILAHVLNHLDHVTPPMPGAHSDLPLRLHASYSREEILTALGQSTIGGLLPGNFREGVRWCEQPKVDALLITREKDDKDFSPQTRYKDYAMSDTLFHWESQNQTSESSSTGIRYRSHQDMGTHVMLFLRRYKKTDIGGPQPWMLLGPADYVSHEGNKPMGITWKLHFPLPADVLTYSALGVGQ